MLSMFFPFVCKFCEIFVSSSNHELCRLFQLTSLQMYVYKVPIAKLQKLDSYSFVISTLH